MAPKKSDNPVAVTGENIKQRRDQESSPLPPWTDLPPDIIANILNRLDVLDILCKAQQVCKTWRTVSMDPLFWREIDMWVFDFWFSLAVPSFLYDMCLLAVDKSQGLLLDLKVGPFICNSLLLYIAERSGKLKSLRLQTYTFLDCDGLIEAIKRLPLLEVLELDMYVAHNFLKSFEIIASSCPLLRSFAFNNNGSNWYEGGYKIVVSNEEAFAIARSMPKLRHLQLRENGLTNEGLKAILDGCPHLESLDLTLCKHVNLKSDLGKRLSKQIKHLTY